MVQPGPRTGSPIYDIRSQRFGRTSLRAKVAPTLDFAVSAACAPPETASLFRLVSNRAGTMVPLSSVEARGTPIFCIHSVAGDIDGFDRLAAAIGPEQRFYGLQVTKARMRPEHAGSIEAIAAHYVIEIDAFQPTGPLVIAGFSSGAIVALEVARRLRALGRDVPLLVALDGAPANSGATWRRRDPRYLLALARNAPRWLAAQDAADWSPRGLSQRLVNRFVFAPGRAIAPKANADTMHLDTVSRLIDRPEWQASQRAFIRAMFNAMAAYVPVPYDGRVILYETRAQPLTHLLQLGTVWKALAADVEIVPLPGKHPSFFRGTRTIGAVAAHLAPVLATLRHGSPLLREAS